MRVIVYTTFGLPIFPVFEYSNTAVGESGVHGFPCGVCPQFQNQCAMGNGVDVELPAVSR